MQYKDNTISSTIIVAYDFERTLCSENTLHLMVQISKSRQIWTYSITSSPNLIRYFFGWLCNHRFSWKWNPFITWIISTEKPACSAIKSENLCEKSVSKITFTRFVNFYLYKHLFSELKTFYVHDFLHYTDRYVLLFMKYLSANRSSCKTLTSTDLFNTTHVSPITFYEIQVGIEYSEMQIKKR